MSSAHCNFIDSNLNNLYNFQHPTSLSQTMCWLNELSMPNEKLYPHRVLFRDNVSKQMVKTLLKLSSFTSLIPLANFSHSSGLFESYYYNHLTWVREEIEKEEEENKKVTNSFICIRMLSQICGLYGTFSIRINSFHFLPAHKHWVWKSVKF